MTGAKLFIAAMGLALVASTTCQAATHAPTGGLFDVDKRKAELASTEFADIRQQCLAFAIDPTWARIPVVAGLNGTDGYGTDRSANDFTWAVMVLSGRSLAGDAAAGDGLKQLLLKWSGKQAFFQTQVANDAYYSLKRVMFPVAVAYSVLREDLTPAEDEQISAWIDTLVRRMDQKFGGDVDLNNHRDMADSLLMLWGAITDNDGLYAKGKARYIEVLSDARSDGSLPLEARRGARSLWYTRQVLASLVAMAEISQLRGDDLYDRTKGSQSLWSIYSYWLNGLNDPLLVNTYAAQNYIPGPEVDFRKQDFGFLDRRSNNRHYMAFMEAVVGQKRDSFVGKRLNAAFTKYALNERPLIDEFSGGNATCFWGTK